MDCSLFQWITTVLFPLPEKSIPSPGDQNRGFPRPEQSMPLLLFPKEYMRHQKIDLSLKWQTCQRTCCCNMRLLARKTTRGDCASLACAPPSHKNCLYLARNTARHEDSYHQIIPNPSGMLEAGQRRSGICPNQCAAPCTTAVGQNTSTPKMHYRVKLVPLRGFIVCLTNMRRI